MPPSPHPTPEGGSTAPGVRQAVILAGGKGTRLASRLNGRPKPLVDICGVPLLERQIAELARYGVQEALVLVNHAASQIDAFFRERDDLGCAVRLIDDGEPLGTAGALLAVRDQLDPRFLVIYGDTLFNIDIDAFVRAHMASGAEATLFLHPNDHPQDSDLVQTDDEGRIVAFHAYPHLPGALLPNLVNAAFYGIERDALDAWRDFRTPSDLAKDLFPAMIAAGSYLQGYSSFEYIKDLGTPSRLDKAERHLRGGIVERANLATKQKCVFVDRDGTLNELHDYVRSPADLELLPNAATAIRAFNDSEYRIALITNQPVIARGEASVETVRQIHAKLETELGAQGAFLDRIYLCPHHPDSGFPGEVAALKIRCECRKPEIGLLQRAARDLNADLAQSWFIGDSTGDMLAANRMGMRAVLVTTGEAGRDGKYTGRPDFVVPDILAASRLIVDHHPRIEKQVAPLIEATQAGDLILIGGLARRGKTKIAAAIACALRRNGLEAQAVSLDNWIVQSDQRGSEIMMGINLKAARDALSRWLEGDDLSITIPSHIPGPRNEEPLQKLTLSKNAILVLEGAPALLLDTGHKRTVRRLFVTAEETRAQRTIDVLHMRRNETSTIEATRSRADYILSLDGDSGDH